MRIDSDSRRKGRKKRKRMRRKGKKGRMADKEYSMEREEDPHGLKIFINSLHLLRAQYAPY